MGALVGNVANDEPGLIEQVPALEPVQGPGTDADLTSGRVGADRIALSGSAVS